MYIIYRTTVQQLSPFLLSWSSAFHLGCCQDVLYLVPTHVITCIYTRVPLAIVSIIHSLSLISWQLESLSVLMIYWWRGFVGAAHLLWPQHRPAVGVMQIEWAIQCESKARECDNQYLNINQTVSTLGSEWTLIYVQSLAEGLRAA